MLVGQGGETRTNMSFFSRKLLLWSLLAQGSKKYFGDEYYTFTLVGITKSCIFLWLIDCPLMVFSFLSRYFLVVNTFDNWTLPQRDKSRVFLSHALFSLLETNLKCHTRTVWGLEWAEIVYLCFEPLKGLMSAFLMLFGFSSPIIVQFHWDTVNKVASAFFSVNFCFFFTLSVEAEVSVMKLAKLEQKITVFFKHFHFLEILWTSWCVFLFLISMESSFEFIPSRVYNFSFTSTSLRCWIVNFTARFTPINNAKHWKGSLSFQIEYCQKCFFVSLRSLITPLEISSIGTDSAKYLKALAFFFLYVDV